jgi:hypothetical protein
VYKYYLVNFLATRKASGKVYGAPSVFSRVCVHKHVPLRLWFEMLAETRIDLEVPVSVVDFNQNRNFPTTFSQNLSCRIKKHLPLV